MDGCENYPTHCQGIGTDAGINRHQINNKNPQ